MQYQLNFLEEPPPGAAPVWAALDQGKRAEVVEALARLMAKAAAQRQLAATAEDVEVSND